MESYVKFPVLVSLGTPDLIELLSLLTFVAAGSDVLPIRNVRSFLRK